MARQTDRRRQTGGDRQHSRRQDRLRLPADDLAALHLRIIGGDAAAADTVASVMLASVSRRLRRGFPRVPHDFIVDAVTDALVLEYLARPQRFDSGLGVPLDRYLEVAARRNLQNRLQAEARRYANEGQYALEQPLVAASDTDL